MELKTAQALTQPFDRNKLKKNPQGMTYIAISEVVARMNEALGVGKWRVEVLNTQEFGVRQTQQGPAPTHIIATVRVHLLDDETGLWTWCDGMGGQDVGFFNSAVEKWAKYGSKGPRPSGAGDDLTPGPLNLGDNYKGACSDATKKALQHFGVGLELARDGVALDITEPTVDLSMLVAGLKQHERKALKPEWDKRWSFQTNLVPEHLEQAVRTLIDSIVGTEEPRPEADSSPAEGGTVEPPSPWPVNQPKAKARLYDLIYETIGDDVIAGTVKEAVWKDSGYGSVSEIGQEEWMVLAKIANAHIAAYMMESA